MNRLTRNLAVIPLASMLILAGGCDDQRGPTEVPDTGALDGDVVFGSANIIVSVYEVFNDFVQLCLEIADAGTPLPVTLSGCLDTGTAIITDNNDSDPLSFRVNFSLFQAACDTELPIAVATDVDLEAAMIIRFTETSPGLRYTIELPADAFPPTANLPFPTLVPRGVKIQTPAQVGVTFDVTTVTTGLTPALFEVTPMEFALNGTRAAGGTVSMEGTLRWEDRGQNFHIVQELDLDYAYSEANETFFAQWPGGSYELASFGTVGGGGFGGVGAGEAVRVDFNGNGGLTFQVTGRDCEGNLVTGFNSCDD